MVTVDLRDLVLLIAVDHAEIARVGQVVAAVAATFGEPIPLRVRGVGPRQMRPRRPGLLAPRPLGPTPTTLLVRRRGLARIIIFRGRVRGVPRVARQQMLQPGQPAGERLVGLHQLRDLHGLRADLPGLAPHHDDQLVARQLLRHGHQKIEPHPDQSPVTDTPASPTCHVTMLTHRS